MSEIFIIIIKEKQYWLRNETNCCINKERATQEYCDAVEHSVCSYWLGGGRGIYRQHTHSFVLVEEGVKWRVYISVSLFWNCRSRRLGEWQRCPSDISTKLLPLSPDRVSHPPTHTPPPPAPASVHMQPQYYYYHSGVNHRAAVRPSADQCLGESLKRQTHTHTPDCHLHSTSTLQSNPIFRNTCLTFIFIKMATKWQRQN